MPCPFIKLQKSAFADASMPFTYIRARGMKIMNGSGVISSLGAGADQKKRLRCRRMEQPHAKHRQGGRATAGKGRAVENEQWLACFSVAGRHQPKNGRQTFDKVGGVDADKLVDRQALAGMDWITPSRLSGTPTRTGQ